MVELTYKLAMAAGQDAGNRNMRHAGRTVWNEDDWNVAAEIASELLATMRASPADDLLPF